MMCTFEALCTHSFCMYVVMCLQRRRAGVQGLIEIENPNRVAQKSKKVTQIELDEPKQLSRRERCVLVCHRVMLHWNFVFNK